MSNDKNAVKCPKCSNEFSTLVSTVNGNQLVLCQGCKSMLKVEVKSGKFTGKVQPM